MIDRPDALLRARRIARARGVPLKHVIGAGNWRYASATAARRELCAELLALGWTYEQIGQFVRRHLTSVMELVMPADRLAHRRAARKRRWATAA